MELDLRLVRSFLLLSEELHFGRAARRLHLTQSALSYQVRRLEATLGVALLVRDGNGVRLTPAGRVLAEEGGRALEAADALVARTRLAAEGMLGELRVGFLAGAALELTPLILRTFRERHPDVQLVLREHDFGDPSAGLRSRSSDVAFVRPPFAAQDLELVTLLEEPRVLVLPDDHPLAAEREVRVEQFAEEPVAVTPHPDPAFRRFWLALDHRDATPRSGPVVSTVEEYFEAVLAGQAVGLAPASVERFFGRPGLAFRPVADLEPCTVALAWRRDDDRALVRGFVDAALAVAEAERPALVAER